MNTLEMNLATVTEEVWSALLGVKIAPQRAQVYTANFEKDLFAQVEFDGSFRGILTLRCPESLACRVASIMFGQEEAALEMQNLLDAVGEVANVTAGNLKLLLPSPCQVTLPAVRLGFAPISGNFSSVQEIKFECEQCYFSVSILERM